MSLTWPPPVQPETPPQPAVELIETPDLISAVCPHCGAEIDVRVKP